MIVNTVHGLFVMPEDPARRSLVYGLERVAAACSDAELLQSEEDLPVLRRLRVPADRLQVLGNGVDLAVPFGCPPTRNWCKPGPPSASLTTRWPSGP